MSYDNKPWQWDYVYLNTEGEYLSKIVDYGIRKGIWNNSPVKKYFLNNRPVKRMKNKKTGKMCQHLQCNICKEWVAKKSGSKGNPVGVRERLYVDHIIPTRGMQTLEDAGRYIYDLVYCPVENLQHLCYDCHMIKTYSESENMTFEEAKIEKEVICIMKKSVVDLKKWLAENNLEYVTPKPGNRDQVRRVLNGISE